MARTKSTLGTGARLADYLSASLLAREPVQRKERMRHEALEEKFPTCALAILDFDTGRWRDVAQGAGRLVDFVRPKDL